MHSRCLMWLMQLVCAGCYLLQLVTADKQAFTNEWVVEIPGGMLAAKEVTETHGFHVIRELHSLAHHYLLKRSDTPHRSKRSARHHTRKLVDDQRVPVDFHPSAPCHVVVSASVFKLFRRTIQRIFFVWSHRELGSPEILEGLCSRIDGDLLFPVDNRIVDSLEDVKFVEQQQYLTRVKRDFMEQYEAREMAARLGDLDDPEFSNEWYINRRDTSQQYSKTRRREAAHTDLRVREVWKMGLTGKNVLISVLDDGLERNHPDIKHNYDPLASIDLNDNDDDPSPRYDSTNENKHGTRCAGVMSMTANNNICGAGIAFDSRIGGIRILDGNISDHLEADSLGFRSQYIDLYTASWGPLDDGKSMEKPRALSQKVLEKGVKEGRQGRGSLYVWASGNGGHFGDNCNADGYVLAIGTISVSSSSQEGRSPYYAEKCASVLTTSYSSGSYLEGKVISTDIRHQCTREHSGTSAAAPMVAGILALLLEANPNITWRDAQHILAHTSRMEPLAAENGWYQNGAGYCVNLYFGFGLVDALEIVRLGDPEKWKGVGEQRVCQVMPVKAACLPQNFSSRAWVEVKFQTDGCAGTENEVNYLEHIQVVFYVAHPKRGNIYAEVQSAMGTVTPLMLERPKDKSSFGFRNWPLMSTHNWGEKPHGMWRFRVSDRSKDQLTGNLRSAKLILYGTKLQPEHQKTGPKNCFHLKNLENELGFIPEISM